MNGIDPVHLAFALTIVIFGTFAVVGRPKGERR
jgi:hypothetical protein